VAQGAARLAGAALAGTVYPTLAGEGE